MFASNNLLTYPIHVDYGLAKLVTRISWTVPAWFSFKLDKNLLGGYLSHQLKTQSGYKFMKLLKNLILAIYTSVFLNAVSYGQQFSATETAEQGVEALLQTVAQSKSYFLSDRDRYFTAIEEVLDSFVDFGAVANVVMNRYADQATETQKQRFAGILKATLTRFYGASLINYDGEELAFLPPANPGSDPRADTIVGMELRGSDSALRLQYQMFLDENDEWKLKNLSLAGINLGRQYFTQFSALMGQHGDNIDLVLDNWQ